MELSIIDNIIEGVIKREHLTKQQDFEETKGQTNH